MARRDAPQDVHKMFCLKISNIGPETTTEKLSHIFSAFGYVGDCYIPMDLKSRQPRNFAFLRYKDKAHADVALFEMNGAVIDEHEIIVEDWSQGIFFTQDTGHITNYLLGPGEQKLEGFDSTMPPSHREALRAAQLDKSTLFSIRVNNIGEELTDDMIHEYFGRFGKIGDISRPIDLKTRKYRNFVFIRFFRAQDAMQAARSTNNIRINEKLITTEFISNTTYFSQDETSVSPKMSGIC